MKKGAGRPKGRKKRIEPPIREVLGFAPLDRDRNGTMTDHPKWFSHYFPSLHCEEKIRNDQWKKKKKTMRKAECHLPESRVCVKKSTTTAL